MQEGRTSGQITDMRYLHTMVRVSDVEKSLAFYRDLDRQFGNRIAGRDKSETIDGARD